MFHTPTQPYDWGGKWLGLFDLINTVTGPGDPPCSPPPPDDFDGIRYQGFRFWLLDRQAQFIPLLNDFLACQELGSKQNLSEEDLKFLEDAEAIEDKYLANPFLYFYEPENLYQLAQQLDLQSGVDFWEPSEETTCHVRPLMIAMATRMMEFVDWSDGHELAEAKE